MNFVKSLANTGVRYIMGQGTLWNPGGSNFHFQIRGPESNRGYGFADSIPVNNGLRAILSKLDRPLKSLTGSGKPYFSFQVKPVGKKGHFQIPFIGIEGGNRGYGLSVDLDCPALADYLTLCLQESGKVESGETESPEITSVPLEEALIHLLCVDGETVSDLRNALDYAKLQAGALDPAGKTLTDKAIRSAIGKAFEGIL